MNNGQIEAYKECIPPCIIVGLVIMTTTVNFDNGCFLGAVKINDVVTDNLLPIKVKTEELLVF